MADERSLRVGSRMDPFYPREEQGEDRLRALPKATHIHSGRAKHYMPGKTLEPSALPSFWVIQWSLCDTWPPSRYG